MSDKLHPVTTQDLHTINGFAGAVFQFLGQLPLPELNPMQSAKRNLMQMAQGCGTICGKHLGISAPEQAKQKKGKGQ